MGEPEAIELVQMLNRNLLETTYEGVPGNQNASSNERSNSSNSRKSRKSLFTTLIRRKVKTSSSEITKKTQAFSQIKIDFNSGTSTSHNEGRFISDNLRSEEIIHIADFQTDSENQSSSSSKCSNFRRLIKNTKKPDGNRDQQLGGITETKIKTTEKGNTSTMNDASSSDVEGPCDLYEEYPTNFMPAPTNKYTKGLTELRDLLRNLDKSKKHLVKIITKYIDDQTFRKQLILASTEYFLSLKNIKYETITLANNMWLQQLQATKYQELNLQKKIYVLVKQNRTLQNETYNLCKLCESLAQKGVLRPKNLLKRSFKKSLEQHLLSKNKSMRKKVLAMACIIDQFEEELTKLQSENELIEQENIRIRSEVVDLRALLEQKETDLDLERSSWSHQLNRQNEIFKESEEAVKVFLQGVESYQDANLPEIIVNSKSLVQELCGALVASHTETTNLNDDVHQMREMNSKLQENLKKSTDELNELTKKLGSSEDHADKKYLQLKCKSFEQEVESLQKRLQQNISNYEKLNKEFEETGTVLENANTLINETSREKVCLQSQIEELLQIIAQTKNDTFARKLATAEDKLEYFRDQYREICTDNNYLQQRCSELESDNQNLLQYQDSCGQEIGSLQEAVEIANEEIVILKKQLVAQHETIQSLQYERVKYLEEKGVLKTIFQHLKAEITRAQELESTVLNMSQETSRLAMIAEYNKQLGEQLKCEVEIRDNTICELRNSVEKLNNIQLDSFKDKASLCAKLSEISVIKDKLNDSLQTEIKKNMELDETKKKAEDDTKTQIRMFEEMQKNERAILKELLRDFKAVVKERDALYKLQEKQEPEVTELSKDLMEQRKLHQIAVKQIEEKDLIIRNMTCEIEQQEKKIRNLEDDLKEEAASHDKHARQMEKMLKSVRKEKEELEASVSFLKNNSAKLHNDVNEAREKERESISTLDSKSEEIRNLAEALNRSRSELRAVNESNYNFRKENENLKLTCQKQSRELEESIKKFTIEHENCNEELNKYKDSLQRKDQEVDCLKKTIEENASKLSQLETECGHWKSQNEEKIRALDRFEDELIFLQRIAEQKCDLENQLQILQKESNVDKLALQEAKNEVMKLSNELKQAIAKSEEEKSALKNQTDSFFTEYNEQKANIEEEISQISQQLLEVTQNLESERVRYQQLCKSYDEVMIKLAESAQVLNEESTCHQETLRKVVSAEKTIANLENERESLQRQVHSLIVSINDERHANLELSRINENINLAMEECRNQNTAMLTRFMIVETKFRENKSQLEIAQRELESKTGELMETKSMLTDQSIDLQSTKDIVDDLRLELDRTANELNEVKEENFKIQQEATQLEFINCELTLQLHEIQGKLETQKSLYAEMKTENEKNLREIMKIHEAAMVAPSDCGDLYSPDTL